MSDTNDTISIDEAQINDVTPPPAASTGGANAANTGTLGSDASSADDKPSRAEKAENKARYKEAKAAYKLARRKAGKTNTPKVIGWIILALIFIALGAAGMWYYMDKKTDEKVASAVKQTREEMAAQYEAEKKADAEAQAQAQAAEPEPEPSETATADANPLVGTWKVSSFTSTTGNYACKGADTNSDQVEFVIKSVEGDKIVADISVVYHAHTHSSVTSDSNSSAGDEVQTFTDQEGVIEGDDFLFEISETGKYGANCKLEISGTYVKGKGLKATDHLQIEVRSYFTSSISSINDVFEMEQAEAAEGATVPEVAPPGTSASGAAAGDSEAKSS